MKQFLLIMGYRYCPGMGTTDWIDFFDSPEQAMIAAMKTWEENPDMGYYEIVDLHNCNPKQEPTIVYLQD